MAYDLSNPLEFVGFRLSLSGLRVLKARKKDEANPNIKAFKTVTTIGATGSTFIELKVFNGIIKGSSLRSLMTELRHKQLWVNRDGYCYMRIPGSKSTRPPQPTKFIRLNDLFAWEDYVEVPRGETFNPTPSSTVWNRLDFSSGDNKVDYEKLEADLKQAEDDKKKAEDDKEKAEKDKEKGIKDAKASYEDKLDKEKIVYEDKLNKEKSENEDKLNRAKREYDDKVSKAKTENEKNLEKAKKDYENKLNTEKKENQDNLNKAKREYDDKVSKAKTENEKNLDKAKKDYENKLNKEKKENQDKINKAKIEYEDKLSKAKNENEDKLQEVRKQKKEMDEWMNRLKENWANATRVGAKPLPPSAFYISSIPKPYLGGTPIYATWMGTLQKRVSDPGSYMGSIGTRSIQIHNAAKQYGNDGFETHFWWVVQMDYPNDGAYGYMIAFDGTGRYPPPTDQLKFRGIWVENRETGVLDLPGLGVKNLIILRRAT